MKAVRFARFGTPSEVVEIVDLPEPAAPGPGAALIEIEACPINPADLLSMAGRYAVRPKLPAGIGAEGVARVLSVGEGVGHIKKDDRVLTMGFRESWRQRAVVPAAPLFALPNAIDPLQLAMLKINPPTAWAMLNRFVELAPGDWIVQNAANSGVGHAVIKLAAAKGLRSVNVVRRWHVQANLRAEGANAVIVDGADLAEQIVAATGGAPVKLALDAIGGPATMRMAKTLTEGGVLINYGLLSGEPCAIDSHDLIFRDIALRGFWLSQWLNETGADEIRAVYDQLADMIGEGAIHVAIEASYPFARIREALHHAEREGRGGKILLLPNA